MAVNMYKIDKIQADLNMHLKLRLDNGELLILNRGYKKSIFETLQHVREVHYDPLAENKSKKLRRVYSNWQTSFSW